MSSQLRRTLASAEEAAIFVSTGHAPSGYGPYARIPWSWDDPVGRVAVDVPEPAGELPVFATGAPGRAYAHYLEGTRRFMSGTCM